MRMSFTGERYVPELRGQIYYEHLHRYALALPLARDKDVLDIASGEGYGAAFLAMVARSVVGVDIDQASVDYASARYTSMNVNFMKGSAVQIPIADASVDVVVSFETIEHLVEQERMLAEFKRVLRVDGRLIISSPNKLIYSDARDYRNPYHVRELYFHEFRDLLRGFFPEVRIFGQRIFAGSAVHPLGGTSLDSRWLGPTVEPQNGIAALPDPEYFIAVCSCQADTEAPNLASIYLDPRDDLLIDIRSGGLAAAAESNELAKAPTARILTSSSSDVAHNNPSLAAPEQGATEVEKLRAELQSIREDAQTEIARLRAELEGEQELAATLERERATYRKAVKIAAEAELIQENFHEELRESNEAYAREAHEVAVMREKNAHWQQLHRSVLAMLATVRSALTNALADAAVAEARADAAAQRAVENQGISVAAEARAAAAEQRAATAEARLNEIAASRVWRLTAPVRKAAVKVRAFSHVLPRR